MSKFIIGDNFKNRTGEKHFTKEGYEVEIIEYFGNNNCTIIFNDEFKTKIKNVLYHNIKSGEIKNKNHKSIFNTGYMGFGLYSYGKNKNTHNYWKNILRRCYSELCQIKHPTYKDVKVCEEWHNFQNFAKWFENNWKDYMKGWHLDKDIICPDCKIYSPETCAFVPAEINGLFNNVKQNKGSEPVGVSKNKYGKYTSGIHRYSICHSLGVFDTSLEAATIYKIAKEQHIKEIANKWKGQIDIRIFDSLHNYEI